MAVDKDVYDAVKQVFLELVLPQLEAIRADLRRLEEKLGAPGTSERPPLSTQGRAYLDAMQAEVREQTERKGQEWAERRAEEGSRK